MYLVVHSAPNLAWSETNIISTCKYIHVFTNTDFYSDMDNLSEIKWERIIYSIVLDIQILPHHVVLLLLNHYVWVYVLLSLYQNQSHFPWC